MNRIDALGDQYAGSVVLTKDLLAETEDVELQAIVKNAAKELKSPIALVSLILDQIQFFKAHVGLPDVLAATRGTHRDASFCQFVVRDGKTFEVNDAPNDARIPQHVVQEYNIHAYLGMPIKVDNSVVGSLCVLDTKKREFTTEEHQGLEKLTKLVNKRLEVITKNRRQARLNLTYTALPPVITELSNSLDPIQKHINLGYSHIASVRSFLALFEHQFLDESTNSDTTKMSFEAARKANQMIQDHLGEIEMSILDSMDCLHAVRNLVSSPSTASLSEIVISAQDLSRNATRSIGGFPLPDFFTDPIIRTRSNLAIALVSNCLLLISSELKKLNATNGIELNIIEQTEIVELIFRARGLDSKSFAAVSDQLNLLIGDKHPTVSLDTIAASIKIAFKTVDK